MVAKKAVLKAVMMVVEMAESLVVLRVGLTVASKVV